MTELPNRLEGWKSIAAHFRRDRTTVMRWARERALPVHRMPGSSGASVFAYVRELDEWMARTGAANDSTQLAHAGPPEPGPEQQQTSRPPVTQAPPAPDPHDRPIRNKGAVLPKRVRLVWGGIGALTAAALLSIVLPTSLPMLWAPDRAGTSASPLRTALPADPKVAAQFIQARADWAARTANGLHRAVAGFGSVVASDPGFAPGYAGLADAYLLIREFDAMPERDAYAKALAAANAALAIDPNFADPHRALGFISYWWQSDRQAAGRHFARALALAPDNAQTHFWFGNCLMDNGELAAGLRHLDTARLINPDSTAIQTDYAWALWLSGNHATAKRLLQQQVAAHPQSVGAHTYLAYIAMFEGDWPGYLAETANRAQARADPLMQAAQARHAQAFAGGGAPALVAELMRDAARDRQDGVIASSVALAFWAAQTAHRTELLTILQDSDRLGQRWGLGVFAARAESHWPTDAQMQRLVDRRRGASLLTK